MDTNPFPPSLPVLTLWQKEAVFVICGLEKMDSIIFLDAFDVQK